jgi:hypothetical protein
MPPPLLRVCVEAVLGDLRGSKQTPRCIERKLLAAKTRAVFKESGALAMGGCAQHWVGPTELLDAPDYSGAAPQRLLNIVPGRHWCCFG